MQTTANTLTETFPYLKVEVKDTYIAILRASKRALSGDNWAQIATVRECDGNFEVGYNIPTRCGYVGTSKKMDSLEAMIDKVNQIARPYAPKA